MEGVIDIGHKILEVRLVLGIEQVQLFKRGYGILHLLLQETCSLFNLCLIL